MAIFTAKLLHISGSMKKPGRNEKAGLHEVVGDYTMAGSRRYDAPGNIRSDMFIRGSRGNILSDEELAFQPTEQEPAKAVVLVVRTDGKILAVSRPDDGTDMNMPGGGIELGETPEDAARRELWEETGLIAANLIEIYREGPVVAFQAIDPSGKIRSSDEGIARWVTQRTILQGTFSDFFRRMIQKIAL